MRLRIKFLACVAALVLVPPLHANPAPLPKPNLNLVVNGDIEAIALQTDGGVVLGGRFVSVNGVARSNLARLLADGTLDPTWNPSADDAVLAMSVDVNGDVYVGGQFKQIGGQARSNLAKLAGHGVGAADAAWNPSADGKVDALALDVSGSVYVAGLFSNIGNSARQNIAKVSAAGVGVLDSVWNPSANGLVSALLADGTDLYVGGAFTTIGGQGRNGTAKLTTLGTGVADALWNPNVSGTTATVVSAMALDGNGAIVIGGEFDHVSGLARSNLAKLPTVGTGAADVNWNAVADQPVFSVMAVSGNVYAGGSFTKINSQARSHLARLSANLSGTLDAAWNPSPNGVVTTISSTASGVIYAGGVFYNIAGASHLAFAAIDDAGMAQSTADIEGTPNVITLAIQHGGGLIVGGDFVKADGLPRANILRLRADGTLDPDWNPSADGYVSRLAVDSHDAVFATGNFSNIGGYARGGVAKIGGSGVGAVDPDWDPARNSNFPFAFNPRAITIASDDSVFIINGSFSLAKLPNAGNGASDPGWNPTPGGSFSYSLVADDNASVYVGGDFSSIGGQPISRLARVSVASPPVVDTSWNPAPTFPSIALLFGRDDALYTGSGYINMGSPQRLFLKVSTSGGAIDPLWNPNPTCDQLYVYCSMFPVAENTTGDIFVIGSFSSIGGQQRNGFAKLSSTGMGDADAAWDVSPDRGVNAVAIDATGVVYVAGSFSHIGSQPRIAIAAFANPDVIFADAFELH